MTDPNVIALLELLTKHTFRGSISPERDAAVRLMGLLAVEKPAPLPTPVEPRVLYVLPHWYDAAKRETEPMNRHVTAFLFPSERADELRFVAAEKPAEAAPVAPALPWVVRWKLDGDIVARFNSQILAEEWRRAHDTLGDYEIRRMVVAPAAPVVPVVVPAPPMQFEEEDAPVVPVKFDADGNALRTDGRLALTTPDGWEATQSGDKSTVFVTIHRRPGEDAGTVVATMLASVGRGL